MSPARAYGGATSLGSAPIYQRTASFPAGARDLKRPGQNGDGRPVGEGQAQAIGLDDPSEDS
jgi:hypothetical protein